MRASLRRRLDQLTLRQQLLGLFAVVMVVLVGVIAWEATIGSGAQRSYEAVAADHLRLRLALRRLQRYYAYSVGTIWTQHVALGRLEPEEALAQLRTQRGQAAEDWQDIVRLAPTLPGAGEGLERLGLLRPAADEAVRHLEQILAARDQAGLVNFFAFELDPATSVLLERIEDISGGLNDHEAHDLAEARDKLRGRQLVSYVAAFAICLALFLVAGTGLRNVYRGIEHLTAVARRLTARDFTARPDHIPGGELGELAQAFVTMQEALAHYERELHERELEARAANQAKSLFLAAMSHEIRTPLIGVLGMLELLGRSNLAAEQRRQFNIVQQSAHSLLEVIGDILDHSKIEAGKVELEQETVAVRDLVSRVVSTFSANAESKGLLLTQVVDTNVAAAHRADGVRLMQILRNFVGNAIKFTERGSVAVGVRAIRDDADGQRLRFTVSDTGIGMTAAQLDRLFQPFSQADAGIARRFGGTGLGLVICRRLAELMGGAVHVNSEPGRGTVMTLELRLPLGNPKNIAAITVESEAPVATRPKPTREQAELEGSLLLLAEDHPVNREVLTGQLNLAGFFVDTAADGTRALETFAATRYGLVLTDLHMPGLDGYQLTAAIREFEQANGRPRTPILALTADVLREHVERCLASGMDDYISKPVTIRRLVEKLRQWLPHLKWDVAQSAESSPVESPSRAEPAVDNSLISQFGGDTSSVRQFLQQYCETTAEDLKTLEEAQRRGDGTVADVAHRIKGAALMIGARAVAEIARQIEEQTRGPQAVDISSLTAGLRQAVTGVEAYLRELR